METLVGHEARLLWSVAARPLPGETESGDGYFVGRTRAGWLVAVADGLGHGHDAAAASRAFLEVIAAHVEAPLTVLVQRCHEHLRTTRGIAGSFAAIDTASATMHWLGIGDVEGLVWRSDGSATDYINLRGGIIGFRLPELRPTELSLRNGDILVLATDGIREGFGAVIVPSLTTEAIAHRILAECGRATDDALVLVARWCTTPAAEPRP